MYDVLPFVVDTPLGPMVQAGIIPLVLVPIWVLYGYLQPLLDEVFADDVSHMHDCECCCTVLSARVLCRMLCHVAFQPCGHLCLNSNGWYAAAASN